MTKYVRVPIRFFRLLTKRRCKFLQDNLCRSSKWIANNHKVVYLTPNISQKNELSFIWHTWCALFCVLKTRGERTYTRTVHTHLHTRTLSYYIQIYTLAHIDVQTHSQLHTLTQKHSPTPTHTHTRTHTHTHTRSYTNVHSSTLSVEPSAVRW